jgi:hypothetical protein
MRQIHIRKWLGATFLATPHLPSELLVHSVALMREKENTGLRGACVCVCVWVCVCVRVAIGDAHPAHFFCGLYMSLERLVAALPRSGGRGLGAVGWGLARAAHNERQTAGDSERRAASGW